MRSLPFASSVVVGALLGTAALYSWVSADRAAIIACHLASVMYIVGIFLGAWIGATAVRAYPSTPRAIARVRRANRLRIPVIK